jgi:hypothetical protein
MAEYRKYSKLIGATLKYDDTVFLGDRTYKVRHHFLYNRCGPNYQIFQDLHIDNATEFCSKAYGYRAKEGCSWPECLPDDYSALTRCVLAIYKIIEGIKEKEQWYKITTPGKTGISPEQVKELILKYGGKINPNYDYNSEIGIYYWKEGDLVDIDTKLSIPAIEVSPTTEITTTKKEEKYETQFQRKKARIKRGTRPEGNSVCGRRSKASVAVGHLSYRKITGI